MLSSTSTTLPPRHCPPAAPLVAQDEPTSGLDSTASRALVAALQQVVRGGVTAAAVIHQPSWEVFKMFDDVLLLGKGGRLVYYGTVEAVQVGGRMGGWVGGQLRLAGMRAALLPANCVLAPSAPPVVAHTCYPWWQSQRAFPLLPAHWHSFPPGRCCLDPHHPTAAALAPHHPRATSRSWGMRSRPTSTPRTG